MKGDLGLGIQDSQSTIQVTCHQRMKEVREECLTGETDSCPSDKQVTEFILSKMMWRSGAVVLNLWIAIPL